MSKDKENFSIVIPVYNEGDFLSSSLLELREALAKENCKNYEIIISENGSIDNTLQIARNLGKHFPELKILNLPKANYGKALKLGMEQAVYPKIILFNIDFWDVGFLKDALVFLEDYDCVLGSKTAKGAEDKRPLSRQFITACFNISLKLMFGYNDGDTHGIKAFKSYSIMPLAKKCLTEKELFDTELLIRAQKSGLLIKEVPLRVEEKRPTRYKLRERFYYSCRGMLKLLLVFKVNPLLSSLFKRKIK